MGVTDLWRVLSPVARKVQLEDLEGQTVAVDLSGWIVESQKISVKHHIRKPHIRNLFFRCRKLLRHGIKLVFVLEGKPPDVKMDTLSQRSQAPSGETEQRIVSAERAGLQASSKQCQELLDILGLPCIQSPGEAECTCAFLNKQKVVDACMTEDGDAFLYGATTVYRKLSIEDKDPHVLGYKMADVESRLGLNREKLIALAVLSGCDYSPGLHGVGKETALRFLQSLQHVDVIDRLRSWFRDPKYEMLEEKVDAVVKKDSHCTSCQHLGDRLHKASGCEACGTKRSCSSVQSAHADCRCDWHRSQVLKQQWRLEIELRKKAKEAKMFPPEDVILEFLNKNDKVDKVDVTWARPRMSKFERFMLDALTWEAEESRDKLFPMLTCWQMLNKDDSIQDSSLVPIKIVKERVVQGADFFEVQWQADGFEGTPPATCEPQKPFQEKYPELVQRYRDELEQHRIKKVPGPQNKDIRQFFQVAAKNRDRKDVVGDTAGKEKPTAEQPPAQPIESRGNRVTRPRKPKPQPLAMKRVEPAATLARYFERTSVEKEDESLNSSLDEFNVPLSQRLQKKPENAETVPTREQVGNAEERKTRSPRKSPRSNAFTISLSDSLKQEFMEGSPSWSSKKEEAKESALDAGCTPPKRKSASVEETDTHATKTEHRPPRRQLSFDTPPSTPFAKVSQRASGTPAKDAFPTQSTPVSLTSREEESNVTDNACPFNDLSYNQSASLFDSAASLEDSPMVVKAVPHSVIEISDDEC
ncbi:unnamed protein product [Ixodes hexagonus]